MQIAVRRVFSLLLVALGTIGALVGVTPVSAQNSHNYPNRAINFVIPFPTGGGSDILGRLLAQRLAERMGQPVVVENRGGASGTIGTGRVAKATPDGYTVLFTPQTPITVAANFQQAPPYDAAKELAPVALVVISPSVVVAPATLPVRNLREFAEYARKNPNGTNYGAPGLGNELRLMWEMIRAELALDTVTVPYQGAGPVVLDLVAGRIQVAVTSPSTVKQYVTDGRLRALAVIADKRHPELPDVGTLAENGLPSLSIPPVWWGLFVPTGTSAEAIERLSREILEISQEPAYRKRVIELGLDLTVGGPAEFGALVARNRAAWAATIKAQNLRIDAN